MQRGALHVAVTEGELLRLPARAADEGIVLRHAAVVVQADHRAGVVVGLLRALHLAAVAEREIHVARAVEHDAPAEVLAAAPFGSLLEKNLHILEAMTGKPAARELGADAVAAACGI